LIQARSVVVLLVGLAVSASCGDADSDAVVCSHDPAFDWDNFGKPFMQQFCNGCHSSLVPEEYRNEAPLGVDFDTYEGVLEDRVKIRLRAAPDAPGMPPGGGPTHQQYLDLQEWLDCKVDPDGEALGIP
jgi:hypothetical protein